MLWEDLDIDSQDESIRVEFSEIFKDYPGIARAIRDQPLGMAVASHIANRVRLHGENANSIQPYLLEDEFEGTLQAVSAAGVVDCTTCFSPGLDGFESEPFLMTSSSSAAEQTVIDFNDAIRLIDKTTFSYVLKRLSSIAVIILGRQQFPNTNQSYTVQSVQQTIYIDAYEHPILTAESIVHEHAHLTFNNYVRFSGVRLDISPRYYSPWKEAERPLFNFLHSLIAFSEVIDFIDQLSLMKWDEKGTSYLEMKRRFELSNIRSVRAAAAQALKITPNRDIASLIQRALDWTSSLK